MNILDKIIQKKHDELSVLRKKFSEDQSVEHFLRGNQLASPHAFSRALSAQKKHFHIIAEVKRKSPSTGNFDLEDVDILSIARSYEKGGASALSVLTDNEFFGGSLDDLSCISKKIGLPTLQKDFIIDKFQIAVAASCGASCVLLIARVLNDKLGQLYRFCCEIGMDALIEVHNLHELENALMLSPKLVGINSRDLDTLQVDLDGMLSLGQQVPGHILKIAESGVATEQDIQKVKKHGFNAALIGTALIKSKNRLALLKSFLKEM